MASDKDHKGSTAAHATTRSQPHQPEHASKAPPEPERHPAQPPPATPGVAQRDQQATVQPESTEPEAPPDKPVDKAEAKQLFRSGHRLRKKGDPKEKWFAAFRMNGQLCIVRPIDDETEKAEVEDAELVLAD